MIESEREQHRRNYDALLALPEEEYEAHRGEYVVLFDGQVVSYHRRAKDAVAAARAERNWGGFSIQEVDKEPVTLGLSVADDR